MSSPLVQTYLFFGGRCEEALDFYSSALGAEVDMLMRFKDNPEPMPPGSVPSGFEEKVMHACFRIGGTTLMASDGCGEEEPMNGFSLSISVETEGAADEAFAALGQGGKIETPLQKTFWSPRFGMVTDKFGVGWMINVGTGEQETK